MKYQTINAGDHFGRLETLERIKIGRRIARGAISTEV